MSRKPTMFDDGDSPAHEPRPVLHMPEPSPPAAPSPPLALVTVILLGDHVYLPRDPSVVDWAVSQDTVRVDGKKDGRRVRVSVQPSLAAFLQERGQAEMLD